MYFSAAFFIRTALGVSAFVTPHPLVNVVKYAGETNGGYIVTFKTGNATLSYGAKKNNIQYCYKIINGCAGKFTEKQLQELQANPDVTGIYEDGLGGTAMIQTNATWGLARLSSKVKLQYTNVTATNFKFQYDDNAGKGTDIYVVDSGVYIDHDDFGGRARWGKTFSGQPDIDESGHGTSCSGLAAGSSYGVAKYANIIAVKVYSGKGGGGVLASNAIAGLDYVHESAKLSRHPSIINMSLWWHAYQPLDDAVVRLTKDNIFVITCAGNFAQSASLYSPARAPSAITVTASNIKDQQSLFSNYGPAIDIFAPGESIVYPFIGDKHATRVGFGTSLSAAYISGLVATLQALQSYTIDEMKNKLDNLALKNVLKDVSSSSDASSPQDNAWNCLLALETQVQTTQTSLTLYITELARLHQTMDTISHSLQMLLEHLPPTPVITPTPPTPPEMNLVPCFDISAAPHTKIPRPALPDTYDGDQAVDECFLQSCVTYIQLSGEAFASDALKIVWVLSYMKLGCASTYALQLSRLVDDLQLCLTFHEGLHPTLMEHIDNLAE
ncbi:hypothetical protein C0995_001390 [Termitomyces sp. Mi166|nr:hypothetical protein C0995_001390 [Termitomyces sp. Mi166\